MKINDLCQVTTLETEKLQLMRTNFSALRSLSLMQHATIQLLVSTSLAAVAQWIEYRPLKPVGSVTYGGSSLFSCGLLIF